VRHGNLVLRPDIFLQHPLFDMNGLIGQVFPRDMLPMPTSSRAGCWGNLAPSQAQKKSVTSHASTQRTNAAIDTAVHLAQHGLKVTTFGDIVAMSAMTALQQVIPA